MGVRAAFDKYAQVFDATRRQLIPCFEAFYGTALDRLPANRTAPLHVLDLGAGTGLLAAFVADRYPHAELTLLDVAPKMLEQARPRFAGVARPVHYRTGDLATADLGGPYDAVVSALAIHHLADAAKAALFARVYAALVPGGVFVNADQVSGPTPAVDRGYRESWLRAVRATGLAEADLAAALERMQEDRNSPLDDQLAWLRAAGFTDVACWFQQYIFAVFAGRRAE